MLLIDRDAGGAAVHGPARREQCQPGPTDGSHRLEHRQQRTQRVDGVRGGVVDGVGREAAAGAVHDVRRPAQQRLHGVGVGRVADDDAASPRDDEGRRRRAAGQHNGAAAQLRGGLSDPRPEEPTADDEDALGRGVEPRHRGAAGGLGSPPRHLWFVSDAFVRAVPGSRPAESINSAARVRSLVRAGCAVMRELDGEPRPIVCPAAWRMGRAQTGILGREPTALAALGEIAAAALMT